MNTSVCTCLRERIAFCTANTLRANFLKKLLLVVIAIVPFYYLGLTTLHASEADFKELPDEKITLSDGRTFIGRYHEGLGILWIAGIGNATMKLVPSAILKREIIVKPPVIVSKEKEALTSQPANASENYQVADALEPLKTSYSQHDIKAVTYSVNPDDILRIAVQEKLLIDYKKKADSLEKAYIKEQENVEKLRKDLVQLMIAYKLAKIYYEQHGPAALGIENTATFQLREAIRNVANGNAQIEAAETKVQELSAKKQDCALKILSTERDIYNIKARMEADTKAFEVDLLGQSTSVDKK